MAITYNNVNTVLNNNLATGQLLTTAGFNGTSTISAAPSMTLGDNVLTARSNPNSLEVKGNVVINGRDLEERLDTIEKVLQIPERDVKLEAKHPKLKELYDEYIHALGKYRTWESIKGEE
jgi:hypothetical protein